MRKLLPLALAISPFAWAHSPKALDEIVVTAAPLERSAEDIIAPAEVLRGDALDRRQSNTLGETLDGIPGVANTSFGAGAGRPIIRGLDGGRVQLLEDGSSSADASALSPDHAVGIDPFFAEQIEVLKGPATLLYGSGAIGGIVNVLNGRMHTSAKPAGASGRAMLGIDTVANMRSAAAKLDLANSEGLIFHVDAAYRRADDYDINGFASPAAEAEGESGSVENSGYRTENGAAGLSWVGDAGYAALSLSRFTSLYGIPAAGALAPESKARAKGGGEEDVQIDLGQTRLDAEAGINLQTAGIESLTFRFSNNNYKHLELEGDEIGTRFDNDQVDARIALTQQWLAGHRGLIGLSFSDRDLIAVGEEAFLPPSNTNASGIFWIQHFDSARWHLDLGGRYERNRVNLTTQANNEQSFSLGSLSAALALDVTEQQRISLNLDRAQRAPSTEELYANGPHIATQAFEIGDATLRRETSNQVELGWRYQDEAWTLQAAAYRNRYDDFIFLRVTEDIEDELPVFLWTQQDARFRGFEVSAAYRFAETQVGQFALNASADQVKASLSSGGALPRIPPRRTALALDWSHAAWTGQIGLRHVADQDDVATFETATNGYTLIDADLARSFSFDGWSAQAYLKGRNLSDRLARVHNSFLKAAAPLPGRNLELGLRVDF